MLLTLLVIPVIVLIYLRLQAHRKRLAGGFFGPSGGLQAMNRAPGFRRHLPPLIFLLGLVVILVALARPHATVSLPKVEGTVMLVFDVSASMGAADVAPTRLGAAKARAAEFVLAQPPTLQIGVVSFSGSGFTVQVPTNDANTVLAAINRLQPTSGTSLGQGILAALKAIAVDAGLGTEDGAGEQAVTPPAPGQDSQGVAPPRGGDLHAQLPDGAYPAAVIVLLSDGEDTNAQLDPVEAALAAAEHQVRVDALGFGTPGGITIEADGFNVHTALNEALLQQITAAAGGTYFAAGGAQEMEQVYTHLTPEVAVKPEKMEITALFSGAGIALLMLGSLLSMAWFNRLP
jgi:Ca-activated chloride channel family protein